MSLDHVGGEDVSAVWIRVAEEVGEADGGKRIVVAVGRGVEFDHLAIMIRRRINEVRDGW